MDTRVRQGGIVIDTTPAIAPAIAVAKPGIAAGVALAGLAGMSLAAGGMPEPKAAILCTTCIVMAASGSAIINVVLEASTDSLMPRVRPRLAALNRLGPANAAAIAVTLILASLALSYIFINPVTCALILAAVISYLFMYTLYAKRRSPYGTVVGGLPGALPVLIGYASVKPALGLDGIILFMVMLLWQPPHFLALALKHKDEYGASGTPVMPVAFGEPYTKTFIFIYGTALPFLTASLWLLGYRTALFGVYSLLLGAAFLIAYYMYVVRSERYGRAFGASIAYIMAVLIGVVAT